MSLCLLAHPNFVLQLEALSYVSQREPIQYSYYLPTASISTISNEKDKTKQMKLFDGRSTRAALLWNQKNWWLLKEMVEEALDRHQTMAYCWRIDENGPILSYQCVTEGPHNTSQSVEQQSTSNAEFSWIKIETNRTIKKRKPAPSI